MGRTLTRQPFDWSGVKFHCSFARQGNVIEARIDRDELYNLADLGDWETWFRVGSTPPRVFTLRDHSNRMVEIYFRRMPDIDSERAAVRVEVRDTVPLYRLVSQQATFGAQGSLSAAGLSLNSAYVNHDPGMAMWLGNSFRGRALSFSHSGSVSGGSRQGELTFTFIRAQSWQDYAKDQVLGQRSFRPAKVAARERFDIPPGTNKITLMLVGDGKFQVSLTDVRVTTPSSPAK